MDMKKFKPILIIMVIVMLTTATACGRVNTPELNEDKNTEDTTLNLDNNEGNLSNNKIENQESHIRNLGLPGGLDLPLGRSIMLNVESDNKDSIKWSSSNPEVAPVEQNGNIIGMAEGESVITASIGSSKGECRVTVLKNGQTLAYSYDPGVINEIGEHIPDENTSENTSDNTPFVIPEDITEINGSELEEEDFIWEIIIDEAFDTELTVPNLGFSYLTHIHIKLRARKESGQELFGEYKGGMEIETAVDEASFLQATKDLGTPLDSIRIDFDITKMDVSFNVIPYDSDAFNKEKYAFAPVGTAHLVPLVPVSGMAISEGKTFVSGDVEIEVDESYGHGSIGNKSGSVPFVIEIYGDGSATLYLPRFTQMYSRFWAKGKLVKIQK